MKQLSGSRIFQRSRLPSSSSHGLKSEDLCGEVHLEKSNLFDINLKSSPALMRYGGGFGAGETSSGFWLAERPRRNMTESREGLSWEAWP